MFYRQALLPSLANVVNVVVYCILHNAAVCRQHTGAVRGFYTFRSRLNEPHVKICAYCNGKSPYNFSICIHRICRMTCLDIDAKMISNKDWPFNHHIQFSNRVLLPIKLYLRFLHLCWICDRSRALAAPSAFIWINN